jgi:hypothetical protein
MGMMRLPDLRVVLSAIFLLMPDRVLAEECLTRAQASARYPGAWLYWHTAQRCWDNKRGRSFGQAVPRATNRVEANMDTQEPPNAATRAQIYYPTMIPGGTVSVQLLRIDPITLWPLIADFDLPAPRFIPWQQRIDPR